MSRASSKSLTPRSRRRCASNYQDTHNVAEGAGAASLAAALKEKPALGGKRAGIILTGGNVDREMYIAALNGAFQPVRPA